LPEYTVGTGSYGLNLTSENVSDQIVSLTSTFHDIRYHPDNGFPIAVNEPRPVYGISDYAWDVVDPIPGYFCSDGFVFWSERFNLKFRLLELIDRETNTWSTSFIDLEFVEDSEPEPEVEIAAEFTDYHLNRPFLYVNRWYVVMGVDELSDYYNSRAFGNIEPTFNENGVYFCEYVGTDYRLGVRVRTDLFGSENAFRITWIEPEPDYDDDYYDEPDYSGYSEEIEDVDVREIAPILHTNVGRTIPMISFEQEFSGDGDKVAKILYDNGFCTHPHAEAYHSSEGRYEITVGTNRMCYVETDSSCGYELIFDRINLRNREEAENVAKIQTILRRLKDEGSIRLNARCGFHTHVDVSDWGMKEIVSGYHLWNYLEDTIFRFASAFWTGHRDEETGNNYSVPVPKGHLGRADIGRVLDGRRDSLNFSPILSARGNCSCNATFYEDWANCTCNIRQPTLEFRVFNATLNPRKIRAYLSFCVAFVNKAKSFDFAPGDFPEMRWQGTTRKNAIRASDELMGWQEATAERIKFIVNEFPLTNSEKSDILYCMKNSSLEEALELI
jgi:Putative amidoligase enzyme